MKRTKKLLTIVAVFILCLFVSFPASAAPKISKKKATIAVRQTLQLKVTGTKSKVDWSTSDKSVATISGRGLVTAENVGKATITARVGKKKYTCKLTVKNPAILSVSSNTLNVGESFTLTLKNGSSGTKWSTSDKNVAAIKKISKYKYRVTGKNTGKAKITVKHNGASYSCTVIVKEKGDADPANNVSIHSEPTYFGTVIIARNNNPYTVDLYIDCIYQRNGKIVGKKSENGYVLEPGRECALQALTTNSTWDSCVINKRVKRRSNVAVNASNISVSSRYHNLTVKATIKNNGINNMITDIAVVYYKRGRIIGYEHHFADVQAPGSTDYLSFEFPYDRKFVPIIPDNYKLYVNSSYAYAPRK